MIGPEIDPVIGTVTGTEIGPMMGPEIHPVNGTEIGLVMGPEIEDSWITVTSKGFMGASLTVLTNWYLGEFQFRETSDIV